MHFENNTPLPAALIPNSEGEDRMGAVVVVAITYRIVEGRLVLAGAQRPLELSQGPIPNDRMLLKSAVSVCSTGFVYPPDGEARRASAALTVGERATKVLVFGVRVWQEGLVTGTLSPSSPLPFERVAMTWKNAFGGGALVPSSLHQVDGQDAILPEHEEAYPFNFDGTGFYPSVAHAIHRPLPQLEHPDQLVQRWDDRPEPVCLAPYPVYGGLRAGFIVSEGPTPTLDLAGTFKLASRAAPRTTFAEVPTGTRIMVEGMRPHGDVLAFRVPPSPVLMTLAVGESAERVVPKLDAVDIDAEAAEVRLVYRAKITYGLVQFELRRLTIEPSPEFPHN